MQDEPDEEYRTETTDVSKGLVTNFLLSNQLLCRRFVCASKFSLIAFSLQMVGGGGGDLDENRT